MGAMPLPGASESIAPKGRSYEKPRPKPGFFFRATDRSTGQKVMLQLLM